MEIDGGENSRCCCGQKLALTLYSEFNRKVTRLGLKSNTVISDTSDRSWCQGSNFLARWHSYTPRLCLVLAYKGDQPSYKIKMTSLHSATVLVPDFIPLGYLMQPPSDSPPPPSHNSAASSLKAPSQSPPPDTSVSIPSHSESYNCQWVDCSATFTDPEVLYNHLCNDHIGRKSTNNLCLTCKWKDCGTSCAKRDHITSHLRGTPFLSLIIIHY